MKKWLLQPASAQDITRLLLAWRLWLLGAVLGALLGGLAYLIIPPVFRAQATVVVDTNMEQAWPDAQSDRDLFTYLSRETSKLVEVAWSDATVQTVVDQVPGTSITALRDHDLHLSQPGDGVWHFYADDPNPARAAQKAAAWASAFTGQARQGVAIATQLDAAHAALNAGLSPSEAETLEAEIQQLESQARGISPYLAVSLSQGEQLPVERTVGLGTYLIIGIVAGFVLAACVVLFLGQGGVLVSGHGGATE
jgi:hypothetical protein